MTLENKLNKWPNYDNEVILKTSEILRNGAVNYWTGEEGKLFENEFSNWCGVKHSLCMANGSLALSAIYKAIGLVENDEIITTPRTFIATSSEAFLLGAKPVFAEVDRESGNITAESIRPLINKKTKAIAVVHIAGWPADMLEICKLAKEFDLYVIEDCSQAHGAAIKVDDYYKSVGSFGDVAAWSFCQDKIMTTGGEGGMVTTNRDDLWELMWTLRDHGKNRKELMKKTSSRSFKWLHDNKGTNMRLTEFQSAIGRIQLKNINEWNKRRKYNAQILINKLSNLKILRIPQPNEYYRHAWYKLYCYLNKEFLRDGWNRDKIIFEISSKGYACFEGGCSEIYRENIFSSLENYSNKKLPVARELGNTSLMFLVHPTIDESQIYCYSECIFNVLSEASK